MVKKNGPLSHQMVVEKAIVVYLLVVIFCKQRERDKGGREGERRKKFRNKFLLYGYCCSRKLVIFQRYILY